MNSLVLLTQSGGILKPLAIVLGKLMNLIYIGLSHLGITNVALTIIIFTIVIYLCFLPLTYQQQKFSKMTAIMNPEIKAIQKKYENRRDQASQQMMQEETQAIYKKYGVNPMGSCLYLIIQLPILFALYRVIYNVPGYVTAVKGMLTDLANSIAGTSGYQDSFSSFFDEVGNTYVMRNASFDTDTTETAIDSIIDITYKCTADNWARLAEYFPNLTDLIASTESSVDTVNAFLGLNVVYAPRAIIANAFQSGSFLLILLGILIPVISAGTQFINIRLTSKNQSAAAGDMGRQMKMMNMFMPIYSFVIVFFLPVGVGIYWIAGALIRSVQQVMFNHMLDRVDMEAVIKKNQAKQKAKEKKRIEKKGVEGSKITQAAAINTRSLNSQSQQQPARKTMTQKANSARSIKDLNETNTQYKKDSLAAKANMVRDYNNANNVYANRDAKNGKTGKTQGAADGGMKQTASSGQSNAGNQAGKNASGQTRSNASARSNAGGQAGKNASGQKHAGGANASGAGNETAQVSADGTRTRSKTNMKKSNVSKKKKKRNKK